MKKIVMIRRTGLGDFLAGMVPICNYLQIAYGKCDFYFFMNYRNVELVRYFFPDAHVYCIPKGNKYLKTLKTALKYRYIQPDIGFSPMPDYPKLNNLFLYLIGAKERYGRVTSIISKTVNHPYSCSEDELYKTSVALCSLKFFDHSIEKIPDEVYPEFNQELIQPYKCQYTGKKHIMVEVSNNRETSQLSNQKTADILNSFSNNYPFSVLITAKESDLPKAVDLKSLLKVDTEIYTTPNIHNFISYVNAADIVLCGDGGLGHIAGALNKKIVALYGKTSVEHWRIIGHEVLHLYDKNHVNNISNQKITTSLTSFFD
ncbi:MAG: glycosyltransferase family 9 protein [Acidaminococcaceae bacterium]